MHAVLPLVMLLFLPLSASAAGYTSMHGTLGGGWEVVVNMEPPATISVWRRTKSGDLVDSREYREQGCETTEDYSVPKHEVRTLTCPSGGASPVAGTKYVGKRYKGNCWKGAPEFLYTCVSGCGKGSKAPKTLRQNYWEC
jgi:hypothetical protein